MRRDEEEDGVVVLETVRLAELLLVETDRIGLTNGDVTAASVADETIAVSPSSSSPSTLAA